MKALTICQPYAELILTGEKPVENRTWWCSYRGPLLIHAGKSRAWLDQYQESVRQGKFPGPKYPLPKEMPFGAIVGKVEMVDCVKLEEIGRTVMRRGGQYNFPTPQLVHPQYLWMLKDPHAGGPFCFVLENPVRMKAPITYRGAQGLFDIPDAVVEGKF